MGRSKNQKWKLERRNRKLARGLKLFDLPKGEKVATAHLIAEHEEASETNTGAINRLVRDRGYGLIRTDKRQILSFHRKDLQGVSFDALKEGDEVEFKAIQGPKGPRAVEVKWSTGVKRGDNRQQRKG